jgi:hypothetical protein
MRVTVLYREDWPCGLTIVRWQQLDEASSTQIFVQLQREQYSGHSR